MFEEVLIQIEPVQSNELGYQQIAKVASVLSKYSFSDITLDFSAVNWFDGNMCSPFGAILYRESRNLNTIDITNLELTVERLLCKNGFLANYGRAKLIDTYKSTIQYRRFEPAEERNFNFFLETQLKNKAIPQMSNSLYKQFIEGLMEIFNNAVFHSQTEMGIFVCGQYYHKKERLDFTITDLGIGIRQNIHDRIGLDLNSTDAIKWAVDGYNTTKRGGIPGGLGLKLLREFIKLNKGRMQIISDNGYWEQLYDGSQNAVLLDNKFPGTIVNIEINTSDKKSYKLSTEKFEDIPF